MPKFNRAKSYRKTQGKFFTDRYGDLTKICRNHLKEIWISKWQKFKPLNNACNHCLEAQGQIPLCFMGSDKSVWLPHNVSGDTPAQNWAPNIFWWSSWDLIQTRPKKSSWGSVQTGPEVHNLTTSSIFQMGMGKVSSRLSIWPSTFFPCSSAQPTPLHWRTFLLISAPYFPRLFQLPTSHIPLFWLCPPLSPSFPGFTTLSLWFPRPCLALSTPLTSYSSHSPAWALLLSLQAETPLSIFPPHTPLTGAPTCM